MTAVLDHVADMTRSRDRGQVDASLLTALMDLLPLRCARLWRVLGEPGGPRNWLPAGHHELGQMLPCVDPLADAPEPLSYAALPQHAACFEQVAAIPQDLAQGYGVLLPMASEREVEGVVELVLDRPLDGELLRVAQTVLRIHRNFLNLIDYSERDTLTGLLNRKSFDETFLRATAMEATRIYGNGSIGPEGERRGPARRHWLGVVDIDHFKQVNDQHGHLIGDEVLLLVARLMRSTFRYDDRLYRFGGEEFVVLLRGGILEQAHMAFERLRSNVAAYVFPRVGRITISIGFTQIRAGDSPAAAFERADKAVYHAKQSGRDQVVHHGDLLERGLLVEQSHTGAMELF